MTGNRKISSHIKTTYKELMQVSQVKDGLAFLKEDHTQTIQEQVDITAIQAPTFEENERGKLYQKLMKKWGLKNVKVDEVGNIIGTRPGVGNGPRFVVSAHLDTVFPRGTDTIAKEREGKLYAPGIADDGRGLAVVLSILRAFEYANIQTEGDLLFVATVGEEGLGDLRGVKALFAENHDIDGFISIEPGAPSDTTYLATGSRRYRVIYQGHGGHSFGDFGEPSAVHALGRAIAKISDISTPDDPKTTFNVGVVHGGTTVNSIAEQAEMVIDMRSTDASQLKNLEKKVISIINQSVSDENRRWGSNHIEVTLDLVGDRPAGSQSEEAVIVESALEAAHTLGFSYQLDPPSSTDSNVPISLNVPAVTLGGGGQFGGTHTLTEYFDSTDAFYGPQRIFLTILGLVGVLGVTKPLLKK